MPGYKPPPPFTDKQKYDGLKEATRVSDTAENLSKIEKDVQDLIDQTRETRNKFQSTISTLSTIDNAKGSDGKPLNDTGTTFTPEWRGYLQEFEGLIGTSTKVATQLGTACINFEDVILPLITDQTVERFTLQEKIDSIESFLKITQADVAESRQTKEGFAALLKKLETFASKFDNFATNRLALDQSKIAEYQEKIDKAKDDIEATKEEIKTWVAVMGLTVWGAVLVGLLLPGYGTAIVAAALAVMTAEAIEIAKGFVKIKELNADIDYYEDEIANVQREIESINQCQKDLGAVKGTIIPNICIALGKFEDVWEQVHDMCSDLSDILRSAGGELKVRDVAACKVFLEQGKTLYKPLGNAMLKYGELQAEHLDGGFALENRIPKSILTWGNTHPILKVRVDGLFKYLNFPITNA